MVVETGHALSLPLKTQQPAKQSRQSRNRKDNTNRNDQWKNICASTHNGNGTTRAAEKIDLFAINIFTATSKNLCQTNTKINTAFHLPGYLHGIIAAPLLILLPSVPAGDSIISAK